MDNFKEKPFELLRKKSGERYENYVIRNYYIARHYVLNLLNKLSKEYLFVPGFNKSLHFVINGTDPRMLSIVRQLALYSHFINFQEEGYDDLPANRTIISIITDDSNVKKTLSEEEYLCNLPNHCKFISLDGSIENNDSYIDIEIHLTSAPPSFKASEIDYFIKKEDVDLFFDNVTDDDEEIFSIDTRRAYYASQMYNIGETIDNLPHEDIHNSHRYSMALDVYQYRKLKESSKPLFNASYGDGQQYKLKESLSNVFCADCFEIRNNALSANAKNNKKENAKLWEEYNDALSASEHARWVVEKLIMGYRPYNSYELFQDAQNRLHVKSSVKLKSFRKALKSNDRDLAHSDLCSYRDLCRIDPHNLKFDSFLMLGIPRILDRTSNPN